MAGTLRFARPTDSRLRGDKLLSALRSAERQLHHHLEHLQRLADFNSVRASVGLPSRTEICSETIKFGDGWLNFKDSYDRNIQLEIWHVSPQQLEQIVTILKADQTIQG